MTVIDEYTSNVLRVMSSTQFMQLFHANVRNNIVGLQIEMDHEKYQVMRQSTEISAYPGYEVYVCRVEE